MAHLGQLTVLLGADMEGSIQVSRSVCVKCPTVALAPIIGLKIYVSTNLSQVCLIQKGALDQQLIRHSTDFRH